MKKFLGVIALLSLISCGEPVGEIQVPKNSTNTEKKPIAKEIKEAPEVIQEIKQKPAKPETELTITIKYDGKIHKNIKLRLIDGVVNEHYIFMAGNNKKIAVLEKGIGKSSKKQVKQVLAALTEYKAAMKAYDEYTKKQSKDWLITNEIDIKRAAEDYVKKAANNPQTVDFSMWDDYVADNGKGIVRGTFTCKNSYGVPGKYSYTVRFTYSVENNSFTLVDRAIKESR